MKCYYTRDSPPVPHIFTAKTCRYKLYKVACRIWHATSYQAFSIFSMFSCTNTMLVKYSIYVHFECSIAIQNTYCSRKISSWNLNRITSPLWGVWPQKKLCPVYTLSIEWVWYTLIVVKTCAFGLRWAWNNGAFLKSLSWKTRFMKVQLFATRIWMWKNSYVSE